MIACKNEIQKKYDDPLGQIIQILLFIAKHCAMHCFFQAQSLSGTELDTWSELLLIWYAYPGGSEMDYQGAKAEQHKLLLLVKKNIYPCAARAC